VPANTLPELVALLKANPTTYSYGSDGNGTASHLTMELLKSRGNFTITHVPVQGRRADGHRSHRRSDPGRHHGTACRAAARESGNAEAHRDHDACAHAAYPAFPTIAEQGFPGFAGRTVGRILRAEGDAARDRVEGVGRSRRGDAAADVQQKMQDIGSQLVPTTPAEFRKFVEDEIAKWSEAVKVSGASVIDQGVVRAFVQPGCARSAR
jgi:tripartite-type tricarboxylate transporter receptor subunit TctC